MCTLSQYTYLVIVIVYEVLLNPHGKSKVPSTVVHSLNRNPCTELVHQIVPLDKLRDGSRADELACVWMNDKHEYWKDNGPS